MGTTRFNSQIVPKDSVAQYGYKFIKFPGDVMLRPQAASTATTLQVEGGGPGIYPITSAGLPGLVLDTTTSTTFYTDPMDVPHDLDSTQTAYVYAVYSSPVVTTHTTATCLMTVALGAWAAGELITTATSAYLSTATAFTLSPAATAKSLQIATATAVSTTPTAGEIMALKISCDTGVTTAATTPVLHGVMFKYFRRFV